MRARTNRRIEAVVRKVDDHLGSISDVLREAVERSEGARANGMSERELTLNLEDLLTATVAEAAARTGAAAVALRVQGLSGAPITAMLGAEHAVDVDWSADGAFTTDPDGIDTRLAFPLLEGGVETGVIVAHARGGRRFLAGHRRALAALAEDTALAVTNARRFATATRRVETAEPGGAHRQEYEAALEREVEQAARTRRPLALVLFTMHDLADTAEVDRVANELSVLLGRVARATDMVFRRGLDELGVLLPQTTTEGARRFHGRLRAELERSTFIQSGGLTLSTGISEWTPDETSDSFDARARASVGCEEGGLSRRV